MREVAERRPHIRDLDHQPLDHVVLPRRVPGHELAGLLGEIHQDRAGFEHRVRLATRPVLIDDHRNLLVRIELLEVGRECCRARPDVDRLEIIRQPALLEHDENLLHVGAGQSVEVDHGPHLRIVMAAPANGPAPPPASACRGFPDGGTKPSAPQGLRPQPRHSCSAAHRAGLRAQLTAAHPPENLPGHKRARGGNNKRRMLVACGMKRGIS